MNKKPLKAILALLLIGMFIIPAGSALANTSTGGQVKATASLPEDLKGILSKYGINLPDEAVKVLSGGDSVKINNRGVYLNRHYIGQDKELQPIRTPDLTARAPETYRAKILLPTGDTAIVNYNEKDGFTVNIKGDHRIAREYYLASLPNHVYLIPAGIDMKKLDINLFDIKYLAENDYGQEIPVILKYKAPGNDPDTIKAMGDAIANTLRSMGIEVRHVYKLIPAISLTLNKDNAADFLKWAESNPSVEKIYLDAKVKVNLNDSVPLIGAPEAWNLGFNGSGVNIAILDTGVDWTHPMLDDFDNDPTTNDTKVIVKKSFVEYPSSEANDPMDYIGHGTHVASTAAGTIWNATVPDSGGIRTLINATYDTPVYSNLTLYLEDLEENDEIYYVYEFVVVGSSDGRLYNYTGESNHVIGSALNSTFAYDADGDNQTDLFKHIYIWAFSSDDDTLAALLTGFNTNTGKNDVLVGYDHLGPGVAPGAYIWAVKVLNKYGWGYTSWIINGIEFAALGPDGTPNTGDEADIISMSLGADIPSDGTDPLSLAVDYASSLGVTVVVAAGNAGPGYGTVGIPASARSAITVGAVDKSLTLAWFSSQGPTLDMRIKPTVVAPGVNILAALPGNSCAALSGTSMATPHVSGSAALLIQAYKQKYNMTPTPQQVKDLLALTAMDLGYDVFHQGLGLVQVPDAINASLIVDPVTSNYIGTPGDLVNMTFTITNLASASKNLTVTVLVEDFLASTVVASTSSQLMLGPLNSTPYNVLLNTTGFSKGLYILYLTVHDDTENKTYRALASIALLNKVVVNLYYDDGSPGSYEEVILFKDSYTSPVEASLFLGLRLSNENGTLVLYLPDGLFHLIWIPWDTYEPTYVVADVSVSNDTVVDMYENSTMPLTFDAGFTAKYLEDFYLIGKSDITIGNYTGSISIGHLGYLDETTSPPVVYVTPTQLESVWRVKYVPGNEDAASASTFYDIITPLDQTLTPITIQPDYNTTASRITAYGTDGGAYNETYTSQHGFKRGTLMWGFSMAFLLPITSPLERLEVLTGNAYYIGMYDIDDIGLWFVDDDMKFYAAGENAFWGYGLLPLQAPHVKLIPGYAGFDYIYTELGMDSLGNQIWFDYGYVEIYFNMTPLYMGAAGDFIYMAIPATPGTLTIYVEDAFIYPYLSYYTYGLARYTATGSSLEGFNGFHILFDRYMLNGTIEADEYNQVTGRLYVPGTYSNITGLSMSIADSDLNTANANLTEVEPGVYRFTVAIPSGFILGPVSIYLNVTTANFTETRWFGTLDAFAVKGIPIYTVGPEGSGADFTSIADAVEAVPPGSIIMVYPGTYYEPVIGITKPLTIKAMDPSNPPVVNGVVPFLVSKTGKVGLYNMIINANSIGVLSYEGMVDLENVTINSGSVGLLASKSSIEANNLGITGTASDAIGLYQSNATIKNALVTGAGGAGLYAYKSTVDVMDSSFTSGMWGVMLQASNAMLKGVLLAGNTNEGLVALEDSQVEVYDSTATGNNIGVFARDQSNMLVEDTSITGNAFAGIATSEEATLNGVEVFVSDTLNGAILYNGPSSTSFSLLLHNSTISNCIFGVVTTRQSQAMLDNVTIQNSTTLAILAIESSSVLAANSVINGSDWAGAAAYGNASIIVEDSYITGTAWEALLAFDNSAVEVSSSEIHNTGRGGGVLGNALLSVEATKIMNTLYEGIITSGNGRLVIYDSLIDGSGTLGILSFDTSTVTARNVTIANPGWAGIGLFHNSQGTIQNVAVLSSLANGIILLDNASATITNSTLAGNSWGIMVWGTSTATIHYTLIENNTWDGLAVFERASVTITNSTIVWNAYGISAYGNATVVAHYDSIYGNVYIGAHAEESSYINATESWWGDPSGPNAPGVNPGSGDLVTGNVDFTPWLASPPQAPNPI
ncbi:MAG: S8 family serine peptidase [Desulfurococcales archaeon]|nr:S8 family serine peptidase [Desulfurococcales archaeon]